MKVKILKANLFNRFLYFFWHSWRVMNQVPFSSYDRCLCFTWSKAKFLQKENEIEVYSLPSYIDPLDMPIIGFYINGKGYVVERCFDIKVGLKNIIEELKKCS